MPIDTLLLHFITLYYAFITLYYKKLHFTVIFCNFLNTLIKYRYLKDKMSQNKNYTFCNKV